MNVNYEFRPIEKHCIDIHSHIFISFLKKIVDSPCSFFFFHTNFLAPSFFWDQYMREGEYVNENFVQG